MGQVPGYWTEEELHGVGNVHKLCRVTIYSNSRVLGHGTQFLLGHTMVNTNRYNNYYDAEGLDWLGGHAMTPDR